MVHIQNLSFDYNPKQHLFSELSISLPSGNIYGLLGKNGAGKSTLLKIISGLLFPKSGAVDVVGYNPRYRYPDFLKEVFLVTEEFAIPSFRLKRYVDLFAPFYPRFDHGMFDRFTREFDLPTDRKLSALSYGQKKKFLLSFGLATDCKLLILDEPTNGLDIPSKSQFRKVLASAIHEDRSFIVSTHQARDMENLIDPIIILDEGKIVFFEDYQSITDTLTVEKSSTPPGEDAVYVESSFNSYTTVKKNTSGEASNMNLELLFNAVVNNKDGVVKLFNN